MSHIYEAKRRLCVNGRICKDGLSAHRLERHLFQKRAAVKGLLCILCSSYTEHCVVLYVKQVCRFSLIDLVGKEQLALRRVAELEVVLGLAVHKDMPPLHYGFALGPSGFLGHKLSVNIKEADR